MDKNLYKLLKTSKKIALFSHENPDPDTIGSTLALGALLKNSGKDVAYFCESDLTENYLFLNESNSYNKIELDTNFDLFIAVDVADSKMLGKFESDFLNHRNSVRLDHHVTGFDFAKVNIVKPYSACAILIFELAKKLKLKVTPEIATLLYFAICGDTSIFRNNNTDSLTFKVCAELFESGADFRKIYSEYFDKKTVSYVKMSSKSLLNAKLNDKFKYAILIATAEDYKNFDVPENDNLGNLPNTYLNCGYKIAVILKEKSDGIHVSLRSKFEFDVSEIASKFGGGGHKNASGCFIESSLADAEKKLVKEIESYLKSKEN